MASSNSTKRAAKMAQRGKGRKVRFQNGTTFPAIIALILVLGLGLIVYSRQSIAPPDATPPQPGASWEVAYGFHICGTWYQFSELASIEGSPAYDRYLKYGFDSQGDGIAYLNVTEENAGEVAGKRAILQKFLDVYGANVGDDSITFSPDYLPLAVDDFSTDDEVLEDITADDATATDSSSADSADASSDSATSSEDSAGEPSAENRTAAEYSEADSKCGDKRAEIAVRVWDTPTAPKSQRYIAKVGQIRISQPAMVIAIYFDDPEAEQTQPPSVETLKAHLAAATPPPDTSDSGDLIPADPTAPDSTATDSTATDSSESSTASGDSSSVTSDIDPLPSVPDNPDDTSSSG